MGDLVVRGLRMAYGRTVVLDGLDLDVPAGSLTAVLGPSGCGKTTLLRVIAGFARPSAGSVAVDGRVLDGLPPERRRLGIVPQEGALFPHLSVGRNVAYGLSRGARRSGRVAEVLALVGLAGFGDRMPHELSGGQQQRVAVARALAPRPALMLLDEPFGALDAGLRGSVRADVRAALRADGATGVLVTHDQEEALATADAVAVLRDGRVVQAGTPSQVYSRPADLGVARFLGDAVVLPGSVVGTGVVTALGVLPLPESSGSAWSPRGGGPDDVVTVLLRPEQVVLDDGGVPAVVTGVDYHGHDALVHLAVGDHRVSARMVGATPVAGSTVTVAVIGSAVLYPAGP